MAKIYGLISGKGGTGKTTSAVNLAAALVLLGEDVMLVDANLSTANIGLYLDAAVVPVTLNHVLNGRADLAEAIYKHESGLKILPSSLSIGELRKIKHEKISGTVEELKKFSEHIILDGAAGLGRETEATINAADEIILVTQAEMPAVTDALKAVKLVEQLNNKVRGFIVTRYRGKRTEMSIENIRDMLEIPLLGVIPEDRKMQKALFLKNPIVMAYPRSIASLAYKRTAKRILGIKEKAGFFSKLFR